MAIGGAFQRLMPNECLKTLIYHTPVLAIAGCLFNVEMKFQHMIAAKTGDRAGLKAVF
jgi:hypothetical protein